MGRPVRTVTVVAETSVPPHRVLAAARDFSPQREQIFDAVSEKHMTVHELGETHADVTEGTRSGPMFNWERCRYDWSQPGVVVADVIDSNIYEVEPSLWRITAEPAADGGSRVEMSWVRAFKRSPKGRVFGVVFHRFGQRIFDNYGRDALKNIEALPD